MAWTGPVERTADQFVQAACPRGEAIPRALLFLEQALAGWARERQALIESAAAEGISFRTLEGAKALLGVQSQQRREKGGMAGYWGLPGDGAG
jgi:hypothetical protein